MMPALHVTPRLNLRRPLNSTRQSRSFQCVVEIELLLAVLVLRVGGVVEQQAAADADA